MKHENDKSRFRFMSIKLYGSVLYIYIHHNIDVYKCAIQHQNQTPVLQMNQNMNQYEI